LKALFQTLALVEISKLQQFEHPLISLIVLIAKKLVPTKHGSKAEKKDRR